jgi:hypothetical protein
MITANSEKYAVSIRTPKGPALFTSVEEWRQFMELVRYSELLRSNRVGGTNKVRLSAILNNSGTVA